MSDQITTRAKATKVRADTSFQASPGAVPAMEHTHRSRAIDIASFLFLIAFQCGAVIAILHYTPPVGEMGVVVFGIIFVWLAATLTVGICDLFARPSP